MQASFVMLHALHGCLAGQPCKLAALQKHLQVPHMDQQHIVQIGMCVWVAVLATLAARTIVCLGFALTAPPEDARAVLVDIRRPQGVQSRTCRSVFMPRVCTHPSPPNTHTGGPNVVAST
eukprot:scaffold17323_cov18-Tisochrysis_lutea.AAC.2